ncbi:diguanylate cyclase [Enterobacteriales bacterium SAP-6]|uniref:diguanylate cyclase n=2 Tax=Acerihabitans arboris TaxID=2691583 RepID=A0A845SLJ2_9GAMM|nr:diguanylate cyclase [Acerihabitans arboris]
MSALITLANGFFATYRVQRQLLIDSTLDANRLYAAKLASTTEIFFDTTQRQLAYSAALLAKGFGDDAFLRAETRRLLLQTNTFNSVAVVNANGVVLATSPETIRMKGRQLTTPGALQALQDRQARISEPYISAAGNLVIFVSAPIRDDAGSYLGYVGGAIYLRQKGILNQLLGQDYHDAGANTFVVDRDKHILYHQNPARIGQSLKQGPIGDAIESLGNGSVREDTPSGVNSLVGYASVPTAGWVIVTVRTTDNTLLSLQGLMVKVLHQITPLTLLTLLAVWLLSRLISQPLGLLARSANDMDRVGISDDIERIPSWYFEVAQLKRAMLLGISLLQNKIGKLRTEAQTDLLTGLFNRRGLSFALEYCRAGKQDLAVVALDIDRFKRVNDTYGHHVGDEVIRLLAQQLRAGSRDGDILCRNGGEEFLMLLPGTDGETAREIAERLRERVAATTFPVVERITISLGVALWTPAMGEIDRALKSADEALYRAKKQGRDQVVMA